MSLKAELENWAAALKAYDEENYEGALELFSGIADSSKILTNMGLIYATLGEHEHAIEKFIEAINLDQYLAIAYFQMGVSHFLLGETDVALDNFDEALLYLRGNQDINYEQLGLNFKLYAAEVLFNKGICLVYLDRVQEGLDTMAEARTLKAKEDHAIIDEAIRDQGDGYTVFSVPVGVLYRPSEKKLKNAMTKDYMGKAKLVAASDATDVYTEFSGAARLRDGISPAGIFVDRPDTNAPNLSRSATAPSSRLPRNGNDPISRPAANLARAQTTINVPANFRERIAAIPTSANTPAISRSNTLSKPNNPTTTARSNTMAAPDRVTRSNTLSGPERSKGLASLSRGPSARRAPTSLQIPPIPENASNDKEKRVSEFYENYLDEYDESESVGPESASTPTPPANRTPNKARAQRASTMSRNSGLRSAPVGGSMKRRSTARRSTRGNPRAFEEEEEGYGSGDYEEVSFEKIRVKIHYNDDIRGMALLPDTSFAEFMDKLTSKFDKSITDLGIKFRDEDGGHVSLRDESDYELALETAREAAKGKSEGKLEIWCADLK
ncbi:NADPH oxidase regulator NoxR [Amanita rubescens]|nr:NADPH oxidase regulator NoxR [Amanita rubescens]